MTPDRPSVGRAVERDAGGRNEGRQGVKGERSHLLDRQHRLVRPGSVGQLCQLPANAVAYVRRIEELVGCPVQIVSTGPSRAETIQLSPIFS